VSESHCATASAGVQPAPSGTPLHWAACSGAAAAAAVLLVGGVAADAEDWMA